MSKECLRLLTLKRPKPTYDERVGVTPGLKIGKKITTMMRNLSPLTKKPDLDEYATVAETCTILKVGAAWVYQLIRMGELEAVRYKKLNYVTRASVKKRIEAIID